MKVLEDDEDFYVTEIEKEWVKSCTARGSFHVTLFSDTNTLKIQYEYTQILCVDVVKDGNIQRATGLRKNCLTHIGNILGVSPSVIYGNKIQK